VTNQGQGERNRVVEKPSYHGREDKTKEDGKRREANSPRAAGSGEELLRFHFRHPGRTTDGGRARGARRLRIKGEGGSKPNRVTGHFLIRLERKMNHSLVFAGDSRAAGKRICRARGKGPHIRGIQGGRRRSVQSRNLTESLASSRASGGGGKKRLCCTF